MMHCVQLRWLLAVKELESRCGLCGAGLAAICCDFETQCQRMQATRALAHLAGPARSAVQLFWGTCGYEFAWTGWCMAVELKLRLALDVESSCS
jgi:hypothetical protein